MSTMATGGRTWDLPTEIDDTPVPLTLREKITEHIIDYGGLYIMSMMTTIILSFLTGIFKAYVIDAGQREKYDSLVAENGGFAPKQLLNMMSFDMPALMIALAAVIVITGFLTLLANRGIYASTHGDRNLKIVGAIALSLYLAIAVLLVMQRDTHGSPDFPQSLPHKMNSWMQDRYGIAPSQPLDMDAIKSGQSISFVANKIPVQAIMDNGAYLVYDMSGKELSIKNTKD